MQVKIKFDGVSYPVDLPEALAPNFEAAVDKVRQDSAESAAQLEAAQGAIVAKDKEIAELKERLDTATSPEAIEAAVSARVELVEHTKKIAPEVETAGRTDREVKEDALAAVGFGSEITEGKSDAFIDGLFFGIAKRTPEKENKKDGARSIGISPEPSEKEEKYDADAARARMLERSRNAWQGSEAN